VVCPKDVAGPPGAGNHVNDNRSANLIVDISTHD
jgi:hypothetical protein